jgi:Tol biopolymer transport system component/endonuclease YncB( thermonuclease family)
MAAAPLHRVLLCSLAALALAPASASAVVPGANGDVAFTREVAPGNSEIYVAANDGIGATRLTNSPGADTDPAWSPDGTELAFTSTRDGNPEIYVMRADGTGVRRLTDDPGDDTDPTWSPDGATIAFTSTRSGVANVWSMGADGSGQRDLTNTPAETISTPNPEDPLAPPIIRTYGNDGDPSFAPDGKRIAFSSDRDHNSEIYVMNADGTAQRNLTSAPDAEDDQPAFSPDGTQIAFASAGRDTGDGIYVVGLGGAVRSLAAADTADTEPAFSPDGRRILFQSDLRDAVGGLYVMQADGTGAIRLAGDASDSAPDWQRCRACGAAAPAAGTPAGHGGAGAGAVGAGPAVAGVLGDLLDDAAPGSGSTRHGTARLSARLLSVTSGDSLRIWLARGKRRAVYTVQVAGIRAPHAHQCGAGASRRHLRTLLGRGRSARLVLTVDAGAPLDGHGHLMAGVSTARGSSLALGQLSAGWARMSALAGALPERARLRSAERRARRARAGLWHGCA